MLHIYFTLAVAGCVMLCCCSVCCCWLCILRPRAAKGVHSKGATILPNSEEDNEDDEV